MCTYLLESGGKRIRPLLIILSGKTINSHPNEGLVAAGTAAELIHMASLVHDDIIDQSFYRRGKPSLFSLWGEKNAVLAGDFLFAKAFEILASSGLFTVLQLMVEAIQEMCQGEIAQSEKLFQTDQKEEDYFDRIYQKTGKFLAFCCQAGAIITKAKSEKQSALKTYGTYLGYTFQIIDDLLDFTGESEVLGKPVYQDLAQGNLTLPVLYLLQHPEHGPRIQEIMSRRQLDSASCALIINLVQENGLLEQTYHVAEHCAATAKAQLTKIPAGIYNNALEYLIGKALDRRS